MNLLFVCFHMGETRSGKNLFCLHCLSFFFNVCLGVEMKFLKLTKLQYKIQPLMKFMLCSAIVILVQYKSLLADTLNHR